MNDKNKKEEDLLYLEKNYNNLTEEVESLRKIVQ